VRVEVVRKRRREERESRNEVEEKLGQITGWIWVWYADMG
jgi:hypothetical protein